MWRKDKKSFVAISILFTLLIIPILVSISTRVLSDILFKEELADIKIVDSSVAGFQGNHSVEVIQLLAYEMSASDLFKEIIVTALFEEGVEIVRSNVIYSVNLEGYTLTKERKHYINLKLQHPLNVTRKAIIYFQTKRQVRQRENIRLELPEIHIQGKDKNDKIFYR